MQDYKIKIISCCFGGHAPIILNNPNELSEMGVDVFNYCDSTVESRANSLHPRLKGKIPKMLEWEKNEDYDYYIWIDSKFTVNEGAIKKLMSYIDGYDLCLFNHPHRSTVKAEYDFMLRLQNDPYIYERYHGEDMDNQIKTYFNNGFIDDKLFACGCFVYSKKLVENKDYNVLKDWFYHNALYSIQDQLSLPYLLQKHNVLYNTFDFDLLNNKLLIHG